MSWRMKAMCDNCPFQKSGAGLRLKRSLPRLRWYGILKLLQRDGHFTCHKTSDETGDGSNLMCAGAIAWQEKRGLSSNLQRVMERLDRLGERERRSIVSSFNQIAKRFCLSPRVEMSAERKMEL
jgi:hypothetical protein